MHVVALGPAVQPRVAVRIGGTTQTFVLDTGAALSALTSSLTGDQALPRTGTRIELSGVGCSTVSNVYRTGPWSVGGVALRPQLVTEITRPAGLLGGIDTLGSDVFDRFPWVVVDFTGGRLLSGAQ
jgi:hypothetical protein